MLQTYTVNGRSVTSTEVKEELHALCCSPCGRFLMTGGGSGMATLRWLHDLVAVIQYEIGHGPITALTITPEECLLIGIDLPAQLYHQSACSTFMLTTLSWVHPGSVDGSLVLFSPDMRRHITRRLLVIGAVSKNTGTTTIIKGSASRNYTNL